MESRGPYLLPTQYSPCATCPYPLAPIFLKLPHSDRPYGPATSPARAQPRTKMRAAAVRASHALGAGLLLCVAASACAASTPSLRQLAAARTTCTRLLAAAVRGC